MRKRLLVGVTGGIGCGKTEVLEFLKKSGYKTFSCDEEVKSLYKNRKFLLKIKKLFPDAVKGRLFIKADKKKIAQAVFSDNKKYQMLSDIASIPAFNRVMKKAKKQSGIVFIEVPLLFEYGLSQSFDKIFVITRPLEDRIKAVKTRSDMTEEEILQRINKQFNYDKADLSSFVKINNDGDISLLQENVIREVNNLLNK